MQLRALRRARERTRIPLWPARFRCIPPRLLYSCSLGEYTARGRVPALALAFGSGSSGEAFSAVTLWQYLWRPAVTLASGSDSGALPLQASDTARGGVRRGGGGAGEDLPCHVGPQRDLRRHCPPRDWDGPDRERLCHHDLPPRPAGPELLDARSHEITRDHTRSHDLSPRPAAPELLDAGDQLPCIHIHVHAPGWAGASQGAVRARQGDAGRAAQRARLLPPLRHGRRSRRAARRGQGDRRHCVRRHVLRHRRRRFGLRSSLPCHPATARASPHPRLLGVLSRWGWCSSRKTGARFAGSAPPPPAAPPPFPRPSRALPAPPPLPPHLLSAPEAQARRDDQGRSSRAAPGTPIRRGGGG